MAAGDFLRRITQQDQLILDGQGNLVGVKNPNANGSDLRAIASYTWASRPASGNLFDRIRISDIGVVGITVVWDGAFWVPDGPQALARSAVLSNLTGSTSETTLATTTVPASVLGLNGGLRIEAVASVTNSANNKTIKVTYGGTTFNTQTLTTVASARYFCGIRNRNSAVAQMSAANANAGVGTNSSPIVTGTVNSAADQTLTITGTLALGTESLGLESYEIWLLP